MSDSFDKDTGELIELEQTLPVTQQRMQPLASLDTQEVCTALAKAQGEFEAPKRTKKAKVTGNTKSGKEYDYEYTYAPLEEVIRVVQKPMAENGLSRQQYLVSRGGQWFVRTIIWHVSGQWISSDYPIFVEQMSQQKFQSGVTYAKRQGLSLALGLAPEDDDDAATADGKPAAATAPKQPPRSSPAASSEPFDPAAAERETKARGLYRAMMDDLNAAKSEQELDRAATTERFREIELAVTDFAGKERGQDYMDQLDRHLAFRRSTVQRLPGEMA